jgi:hypothetical protein
LVSISSFPASGQPDPCRVLTPELQGAYKGSCKNGLADGFGEATGKVTYTGNFVAGHAEGEGLAIFPSGTRYEGSFVADQKEGAGTVTFPNGDVLRGHFKRNRLDGVGELTSANGAQRYVTEGPDKKLAAYTGPEPRAPVPISSPPASTALESNRTLSAASTPTISLPYGGELFPAFILSMATAGVRMQRGASDIGDPNGSLRFLVHADEPQTKVVVRVELDDVADPTTYETILPAPGNWYVYPVIRYRYAKLRSLQQPATVNLTWSVSVNGRETQGNAQPVRVRSVNDVPYRVRKDSGDWVDTRFLFAAFVNEDHPWINPLLQEALKTGKVSQFTGYYSHRAEEVFHQIDAVWTALQRRGVRYSSVAVNSDVSERVKSQHVRLLDESVRYSQANCVDGTVMLASILQRIGLHTSLILVPGHMFLQVAEDADDRTSFYIETTMIGNADLKAAIKRGKEEVAYWESPERKDKIVSVKVGKARSAGVVPITR